MVKDVLKCRIRASSTIEAAVVMSAALLCLMLIMFTGFYFHDVNILAGAACESAQVAGEWERMEESKSAEAYFQKRIQGKMLYFSSAGCTVDRSGKDIIVKARASSARMKAAVSASARMDVPEEDIRRLHMK
ncbi:MAG: pilus assembly protein [Lachnospiraceae bacterium]|nr:pilus assembly protein [Lachnospiraceae bacterium]MBR2752184.1 pilus assembly protein [Lachnospiraceae bacterium]